MKVYLAGPMRGLPRLNVDAFDQAAAFLRELGYEVISPAEMDREMGIDPDKQTTFTLDEMRAFARKDTDVIASCDAIVCLRDWRHSKGATAEVAIARWIGLPVYDLDTMMPIPNAHPATPISAPREVIHNGAFVVKDSGARQQFETGAQRDAGDGKGFFHLIPYTPMERLAQLYEAGAKKYGKNNWRRGIPLSKFLDSAERHLLKLADGWVDEDHAAAAIWNVVGYIWTEKEIKDGRLPKTLADMNT